MSGNAIEVALRMLDERAEWLAEDHTSVAIRRGGVAIWHPDVVLVAVPWDPVAGEDGTTMAVLFCAGDAGRLAAYGAEWAARGYTHVCWCRGFRDAGAVWRKFALERWARLCKRLNAYGC